MYSDVTDLERFYASRLGQMARRLIRRRIRAIWPDAKGLTLAGLGYASPYLGPFRQSAERVLLLAPAQQGVVHWPRDGRNLATQVHDDGLPLQDVSVDRVLIVNGLEGSETARTMLQEAWRILGGDGRLMVVVPNRLGLWTRLERTPFGHGHPYSLLQLSRLLQANGFVPEQTAHALYPPPYAWRLMLRSALAVEEICARRFRHLGGVIILEAGKRLYATRPARTARSRQRTLVPAPAHGPPVSATGRRLAIPNTPD